MPSAADGRGDGPRLRAPVAGVPPAVLWLLAGVLLGAIAGALHTWQGLVPGLTGGGAAQHTLVSTVRALADVTAVATVGLCLFPRLLGPKPPAHTQRTLVSAGRATAVAALAWMLFSLLTVIAQAVELTPASVLSTVTLLDYLTRVPSAAGPLLSAACAGVCAVLCLLAVRSRHAPAEVCLPLAVLGVLPIPLAGHPPNTSPSNTVAHAAGVLATELHVVSAAAWTGGLLAIVLLAAPRRGLLAAVLPRYSMLAAVALLVVGVSGALDAALVLGKNPANGAFALFTTGYGQLVLVKLVSLVALGVLGGHVRWRLLPGIARHQRSTLVTWAAAELAVMGLACGLGAVLTRTPLG